MKVPGALLAIAVLTALNSSIALARAVPTVDHVRLGMTSIAVLRILRTAGNAPMRIFTKPCLKDYLAQHRKIVSLGGPGSCMQSISMPYAGGDLLIFFTEDIPRRPGISIVTTIALNYPTDPAAVAAVMQQARQPSLTDGRASWVVAMWCFNFACRNMDRVLTDRYSGPMMLVHRGAGFTIADAQIQTKCEEAASNVLAAHGVELQP